ncbi:MAG TPA: hypothetical protein VLH08_11120 [Acidobacteriota bacterium]|nr:hypothetical protein [Acidobacteriota bacterium]
MKKHIVFTFLILFGFFHVCFAQEKLVAVTAEKEVDIQGGDTAAARTVALAAAARDAVEKAYGTYIKIEELPNARTILAQSAARLQYNILAEQKRGNKYWVKIQANVAIPAEYVMNKVEEREELGEPMQNYVQKYPQGEVNWGEGFVHAYGKGVIESGKSEDEAARAAEIDAKAHLLEIVHDIPVDDRSKAGENERMSFALEGFVQGAEVVARSRQGSTVNVTVRAPVRGVKGLSMTLYGFYTPPPPDVTEVIIPTRKKTTVKKEPPKPEQKPEQFTGIVIDARAVPTTPAIFPKIQDTKKREVYGVSKVSQEDLEKRGMASYAIVAREVKISRMFPNAIIIRASYSPDPPKPGEKKKRRQGYNPMLVKAAGTDGKLKATLIVSEADAQKIVDADDESGVLKNCKVVVVVSSEVGGLEGKLHLPRL